ncbi:MAG TPA: hypothetical protein VKA92_10290 [Segetibacter sp.]|nr:hypothetical protein [Segetibacter sp.]
MPTSICGTLILLEIWRITDEMAAIRRGFLPQDLQPVLKENGVDGRVVVPKTPFVIKDKVIEIFVSPVDFCIEIEHTSINLIRKVDR